MNLPPPFDDPKHPARLVYVESPYASGADASLHRLHMAYLKDCLDDCFARGEYPYASHAMFPHIFGDDEPLRSLLMECGFAWGRTAATVTVVYQDLGVSPGMALGINRARKDDRPIEYRSLPQWAKRGERTVKVQTIGSERVRIVHEGAVTKGRATCGEKHRSGLVCVLGVEHRHDHSNGRVNWKREG